MREKLKSLLLNDQLFYGFLLILVGLGSFGLGRLSVTVTSEADKVRFNQKAVMVNKTLEDPILVKTVSKEGELVASKTGTKYHRPDCPGAKQIKPENRITFASAAVALAAGYTPAANCPGLK